MASEQSHLLDLGCLVWHLEVKRHIDSTCHTRYHSTYSRFFLVHSSTGALQSSSWWLVCILLLFKEFLQIFAWYLDIFILKYCLIFFFIVIFVLCLLSRTTFFAHWEQGNTSSNQDPLAPGTIVGDRCLDVCMSGCMMNRWADGWTYFHCRDVNGNHSIIMPDIYRLTFLLGMTWL